MLAMICLGVYLRLGSQHHHSHQPIAREALSEIGETRLLCLSLEVDLPLRDLLGQGLLLYTVCADGQPVHPQRLAAQDAINVQAQTDLLQLNAQQTLTVQSAQAGMDIAAARKLRIARANQWWLYAADVSAKYVCSMPDQGTEKRQSTR
ncbi:DUF2345 domain-containing protein [Comamonas sp. NoAH]|uniref:DUF2345 domain-containing protein n=1 Tax=Comamonas halotolerans TaxID=3041496 RepID=UPI0024E0C8D1|nr:DUF2345 domain-containing protein [Comamonas sp. NoAH]